MRGRPVLGAWLLPLALTFPCRANDSPSGWPAWQNYEICHDTNRTVEFSIVTDTPDADAARALSALRASGCRGPYLASRPPAATCAVEWACATEKLAAAEDLLRAVSGVANPTERAEIPPEAVAARAEDSEARLSRLDAGLAELSARGVFPAIEELVRSERLFHTDRARRCRDSERGAILVAYFSLPGEDDPEVNLISTCRHRIEKSSQRRTRHVDAAPAAEDWRGNGPNFDACPDSTGEEPAYALEISSDDELRVRALVEFAGGRRLENQCWRFASARRLAHPEMVETRFHFAVPRAKLTALIRDLRRLAKDSEILPPSPPDAQALKEREKAQKSAFRRRELTAETARLPGTLRAAAPYALAQEALRGAAPALEASSARLALLLLVKPALP